jgi:hypothetical protein
MDTPINNDEGRTSIASDSDSPNSTRERSTTFNLVDMAMKAEEKHVDTLKKIEKSIDDKVLRDQSPEAKRRRQIRAVRAGFGEFMCTFLFFTPVFGCLANMKTSGVSGYAGAVISAFVAGFQAIAVSFAFSSVSGAHFNPAISWALVSISILH